jgi:hypothetical protein
MKSRLLNTARIISGTLSWHPLGDGRKARISVGTRKRMTERPRMRRQRRRRKLGRERRRFGESKRQRTMLLLEH